MLGFSPLSSAPISAFPASQLSTAIAVVGRTAFMDRDTSMTIVDGQIRRTIVPTNDRQVRE